MFLRYVRSSSPKKKMTEVSWQYKEIILLTTWLTRQSVIDGRNYTMKLALKKTEASSMYHKPTNQELFGPCLLSFHLQLECHATTCCMNTPLDHERKQEKQSSGSSLTSGKHQNNKQRNSFVVDH